MVSLGFYLGLMIKSQLQRPSAWTGDGWTHKQINHALQAPSTTSMCVYSWFTLIRAVQRASCPMFSTWITGCSFTLHVVQFVHIPLDIWRTESQSNKAATDELQRNIAAKWSRKAHNGSLGILNTAISLFYIHSWCRFLPHTVIYYTCQHWATGAKQIPIMTCKLYHILNGCYTNIKLNC